MFWTDIEPVKTNRLTSAISTAYQVFAGYRPHATITHCGCPACMTPHQAEQLSRLPLDKIEARLLAQYTNSAHGYDFDVIEPEFKYLLPRYLDLIGNCDMPSHLGVETSLQRLGAADYRTRWPWSEAAAVDEFFHAFIEASSRQLILVEWPAGLRLRLDIGEVLTMIAIAGGDLHAILATLDNPALDPGAATHLANLRCDVEPHAGVFVYNNAHLMNDHLEAAVAIGTFVMRDCVTARILDASDRIANSDYDDIFGMALGSVPRRH